LTAAASIAAGTASLAFQGTSGSLNHSAQVSLTLSYVAPDFSISVTPTSLSLDTGGSQDVTVSAGGSNGFSASVSVSAGGLPAGVAASPATFMIAPGGQQQVALVAAAGAAPGQYSVVLSGTSGSLTHSSQISLTVVAAVTGMHAPIRIRALRTDASLYDVDDWQWDPARFTAYDAAHRQFFVSNPYLNKIDVFSAADEVETAKVPVPGGPWGLDVSPFDGNLYVGTLSGDIYVINTGTLAVAKRYPAHTIGPSGFPSTGVLALPGGLFALESQTYSAGGAGDTVVVWDPAANTIDSGPSGTGELNVCSPVSGPLALSGDRTRILVADTNYCYTNCQACSYDPVSKQATIEPTGAPARALVPSPDGKEFFAIEASQIQAYDTKALQMVAQNTGPFPWNGVLRPEFPELDSGVVSTDGKKLYVYDLSFGEIDVFDPNTLAQIGWAPSPAPGGDLSDVGMSGNIGAIDETGLIAGPISGGVEFIDGAPVESSQPTDIAPFFPAPESGPLSGGTSLSDLAIVYSVTDGATLAQAYIGNTPAQTTSFLPGSDQYIRPTATTPPSSFEGAVDTTVALSDGAVEICMECFSYGPSIIELVSNAATADGGETGLLVGYGFGGNYGIGGNSDSSPGVSVTIGGQPATVLAVMNGPVEEPYPFNSDELVFTIPPGTAGAAADVTLTASSGSTTASGAFHYVPVVQSFPVSDTLQQGVYDAGRDLYYFAGKTQIEVLSLSQGKWLPPIVLPAVSGSTQLIGIAESPDGTKMAVSDNGGQAIYVLSPDSPASAVRFSLLPADSGSQYSKYPAGLAITNTGAVYYTADSPAYPFLKLNATTGHVAPIGQAWAVSPCQSCRVVESPDGSRIYGDGGSWVNPSNDQVTLSYSFGGGPNATSPELAVSGDGSTLDVDSNFADPSMYFESALAYTDWEWFYPGGAPSVLNGEKLNGDGSILFMPVKNAIDLYARNTGRLLYRVQMPVTPASVFDPLVPGKGTNVLAVITAGGVSIVDMSTLPIGAQYTQPFSDKTHTVGRRSSVDSSALPTDRAPARAPGKLGGMTIRRTPGPKAAGIQ
jgi:hypothetical protein